MFITLFIFIIMSYGTDSKVETSIHDSIRDLGVQRAWSEFMNVLANPKGSVGRWNMNFGGLSSFPQIFEAMVLYTSILKP
jgi:hypothetical protein